MESPFYLAVRLVVAGYVLYKVWLLLFDRKLYGFWDWAFRNAANHTHRPATAAAKEIGTGESISEAANDRADVVGRTHTVYLEDPRTVSTVPTMSQPLESSGFIGEETETKAEEIDASLAPPSERETPEDTEDLNEPDGSCMPPDDDFPTCLTYQQMEEAMDVLAGATADEKKVLRAAEAIYSVKNTDLFELFTRQAGSTQAVEALLADYLDESGEPLPESRRKPARDRVAGFDMRKYV